AQALIGHLAVLIDGAGQRLLPASGQRIQTETIVQANLNGIDITINIHPVVFDLGRPIVPERILGADAEQQSTRRSVRNAHPGQEIFVAPRAAHFAVDHPTVDSPAEARSDRGRPVEIPAGPRHIRFNAKDPLASLIIEADLPAAQEAAVAVVDPSAADMAASVEPGPVIDRRKLRTDRRTLIRGISENGRRYQRRRNNKTRLQTRIHVVTPPVEYY